MRPILFTDRDRPENLDPGPAPMLHVQPQPWKEHETFMFDLDDEMVDRLDALAMRCEKQGVGVLASANYHGQGQVNVPAAWLRQLLAAYRSNAPAPQTQADEPAARQFCVTSSEGGCGWTDVSHPEHSFWLEVREQYPDTTSIQYRDLYVRPAEPQHLEVGTGKLTVTTGHMEDVPVLFIAPARFPGEPGASAEREDRPKDRLLGDELIFTFPTIEQAHRVADAFCNTPPPTTRQERGEQFIRDAIRSAYDSGYNDARNAKSVPGDRAVGYRGRDMANEIAVDVLARLQRLTPSTLKPDPIAYGCFDGDQLYSCHLSKHLADDVARDHPGSIVLPLYEHPSPQPHVTALDWSNFDGPKRNVEWTPDDQDLIYTALNYRDDDYGDADEDVGQQIVERLLAAWKRASEGRE